MPQRPQPARMLHTKRGHAVELPTFLPVYQPHKEITPAAEWKTEYGIHACILNAYFLYKNRELRTWFGAEGEIHDYIGFDGVVMTDSGAYQGFTRPLLLANKKIVRFQDAMGADIISPLDLVTPPGDKRTVAERKLEATQKRIREAVPLCRNGTLAGVQQGGRFRELRRRAVEELMEIGVEYLALGSLVPFFNRNHELGFVADIVREARSVAGPDMPIHIFGAGDPVELPFLVAFGADIFDSSSYGHYAAGGWYMTPYGAFDDRELLARAGLTCDCPTCAQVDSLDCVYDDEAKLRTHNLWCITHTMRRIREALASDTLLELCTEVADAHSKWFPDSLLRSSWEQAGEA